ncbi:hypothetical protein R5R35_003232 [Gryllus longicercus]|uniref:Nose resistant-to-fluoxetine protein N-terminal domain-containing protein n=1 Tax=Gryllus longicercus TaxID=2509291 RepID=A0AAN9VNN0_9ORTH
MQAGVHPGAQAMQDASVRVPEGLLKRSWTHFGNWKECVDVRDVPSAGGGGGSFHGQMCMVKLYPTLTGSAARADARAGLDPGMVKILLNMLNYRSGQCVPSTCSAREVQQLFEPLTVGLPTVAGIQINVSVTEDDCTTRDRPALDATDWVGVAVLLCMGAIMVISTAYDVWVPAARKRALLAAFSVVSNGRKLLAMPRQGGDQTLSCLHGIRFISMAWVVLGHRYMASATVPAVNGSFTSTFFKDWYRIGITNATVSVDTFFLVSGLLVGYLFFQKAPAKRRLNVPMYYLHRYLRLTPALAMMVLLSATVAFHVGWGPQWTTKMMTNREGCRENWWSVLLYIGNYIGLQKQCVPQSWYLMVDMQLHWLSPLALILLARKPRLGLIVLAVLCVAGLVGNFVFSYVEDLAGSAAAIGDDDERKHWNRWFYFPTFTRFVPYLEGLALGFVMGNQRLRVDKPIKLRLVYCYLAWLLVAALMLVPLGTGYNIVQYPGVDRLPTAFYNALHRPAWALGIGGVAYLCATGNGGPVNTLLSWYGFQVLGRFSYCVYLVHMILQDMQVASMKTIAYLSDSTILSQFAGDLLLSIIIGGVLSLMCESPFLIIEKELFGRFQGKGNASKDANAQAQASPSIPPMAIGEEKSVKEH